MTRGRHARAGRRARRSSALRRWHAPGLRTVLVVGTAVPVMGLVAGCSTTYSGSTVAQQVSGWSSQTNFPAEARTVQQDMQRVATVVAQRTASLIRTDCDVLVTDALIANQNLPTPDTDLTDLLASTYASAATAGRDCLQGAGGDVRLLARSASERAMSATGMVKAMARYDALVTGLVS